MTIEALIEKLSAATGPDRDIDGALVEVFATHPPLWKRKRGSTSEWGNDHPLSSWDAPRYTASLDAALALVEKKLPGWDWEVHNNGLARLLSPEGNSIYANAPTPALALCLALLRALQAMEA